MVGAGVALPCALAEQARYRVYSCFDFPGRCESRRHLLRLLGVLCMQWLCPQGDREMLWLCPREDRENTYHR